MNKEIQTNNLIKNNNNITKILRISITIKISKGKKKKDFKIYNKENILHVIHKEYQIKMFNFNQFMKVKMTILLLNNNQDNQDKIHKDIIIILQDNNNNKISSYLINNINNKESLLKSNKDKMTFKILIIKNLIIQELERALIKINKIKENNHFIAIINNR